MNRIPPLSWILPLAACLAPALAGSPPRIPPAEERRLLLISPKADRSGEGKDAALEAVRLAAQDDFDVTRYALDLEFQEGPRTVSGSVTVTADSLVGGLSQVVLDLHPNMAVSSVMRGPTALAFTHAGELLEIDLDQPFDAGQPFEVTISYSGSPATGVYGPFGWNKYWGGAAGTAAWSLSEPEGARFWWPCKDRPDDKALVEEWWTVRSDWIATGNGTLADLETLPQNRTRYHWKATHPLTTYLVSVTATNFVSFSQTYITLADGTMPIVNHVYAEDLADAQVSLSGTPAMLAFFAGTFGEYPFVEDQYGHSAFPFPGAMEHSANTSYGYQLLNGAHTYDYVVAHEAAHQWWGDSVSPETWADVWLNEGFATYSEALWSEHLGGAGAYHDYMAMLRAPSFSGPVYDPIELFGSTVYDKGGWVLHMLRHVMGDAAFFDTLRDWYQQNADGVGDTAAFQAAAEVRHGGGLGWFFQPWVYGEGRPAYQVGHTTADLGNGTFRNYVRIAQVQAGGGTFVMPVDLTLTTASGGEVRTVWNDAADQDFFLDTTAPLLSLGLDEMEWILREAVIPVALADGDADGVPDRNDNCAASANPAQEDQDGDGAGDACDDDDDGDLLPDAADCAPLDPGQGTPEEVAGLDVTYPAGLSWYPALRADSYDVARGMLSALWSGYGACLATGVAGTTWSDAEVPPPGDGFHYVVFGRDSGCGGVGPGGTDSGGLPRPPACP